MEQIKMPAEGASADETGILLRSASPHGFGVSDADGNVICLDVLQATAMRMLGQDMSFENFAEGLRGNVVRENRIRWQEIKESLGGGLPAEMAEERADEALDGMLRKSYLENLSDEEVSELRSRVRRIRRGLEVQQDPFRWPPGTEREL